MTEEEKKRIQLETLQKLKDLAGEYPLPFISLKYFLSVAIDALDLSQLTIEDLRKAVDVPKELRANQGATIMHQMEEIRKLVIEQIPFSLILIPSPIPLDRRTNRYISP